VACSLKVSGMVSLIEVLQPVQQAAQIINTVFLIGANILSNLIYAIVPPFPEKGWVTPKKNIFSLLPNPAGKWAGTTIKKIV